MLAVSHLPTRVLKSYEQDTVKLMRALKYLNQTKDQLLVLFEAYIDAAFA